jgi:hypothetical protein
MDVGIISGFTEMVVGMAILSVGWCRGVGFLGEMVAGGIVKWDMAKMVVLVGDRNVG